jgi:hypothetical protein
VLFQDDRVPSLPSWQTTVLGDDALIRPPIERTYDRPTSCGGGATLAEARVCRPGVATAEPRPPGAGPPDQPPEGSV